MTRFLAGKGSQYLIVLAVAISLNFLLPRLMPGNPLALLAGEDIQLLSAEQRQQLQREYGLDQSLPEQYVRYLGNLTHGDLGYSIQKRRPVTAIILERLPWTLLLTGASLVLSTLIGGLLGAVAAWRRGRRSDVGLLSTFLFLESLPSFWLGMVLIALFSVQLHWLPSFGAVTPWVRLEGLDRLVDVLKHLVLPLATLTVVQVGRTFLIMRYAMLGVLGEEYIRAARAKGLAERALLFRHALRNALLPVFTVFMLSLGFAVAGATVVETVFSYPGVGRLMYEAVLGRDYPVLQAGFLVVTLSVLVANLLTDLAYPLLDPRVRRG